MVLAAPPRTINVGWWQTSPWRPLSSEHELHLSPAAIALGESCELACFGFGCVRAEQDAPASAERHPEDAVTLSDWRCFEVGA